MPDYKWYKTFQSLEAIVQASAPHDANIIICLRPYNPEGISAINNVKKLSDRDGWHVNGKQTFIWTETALYVVYGLQLQRKERWQIVVLSAMYPKNKRYKSG